MKLTPNQQASRILRDQGQIDTFLDHRSSLEILESLVNKGILPGELLSQITEIEPVTTDINQGRV